MSISLSLLSSLLWSVWTPDFCVLESFLSVSVLPSDSVLFFNHFQFLPLTRENWLLCYFQLLRMDFYLLTSPRFSSVLSTLF